jgi:hypothetical protein
MEWSRETSNYKQLSRWNEGYGADYFQPKDILPSLSNLGKQPISFADRILLKALFWLYCMGEHSITSVRVNGPELIEVSLVEVI